MAKEAAKEKFHTQAEDDVYDLLSDVVEKFHKDFVDSEFLILFKHGGWKSKGRTVFARFKVLGDDLRSTWQKDAILYLNADMWKKMSEPQKLYVLDEALYGLELKSDRHGDAKEAPDGRALLTTVSPDIQGFVEVMKRHGAVTADVKRLASALVEMNQLSFDDIEKQEVKQIEPPHEGVTGKINPDGTIDIDDENQAKLDDYINEGTRSESEDESEQERDEEEQKDDSDELF